MFFVSLFFPYQFDKVISCLKLQNKHNIPYYGSRIKVLSVLALKQVRKIHPSLAFLPVSTARTNKFFIRIFYINLPKTYG